MKPVTVQTYFKCGHSSQRELSPEPGPRATLTCSQCRLLANDAEHRLNGSHDFVTYPEYLAEKGTIP